MLNTAARCGLRAAVLSGLLTGRLCFARPPAPQVPTAAMDVMQRNGASFAGFATYLDSSPAEPDTFAMPDTPACAVQLPWKREVAWVPADPVCRGQPIAHAPRNVLKRQVEAAAAKGFVVKTGVECEFFLLTPDGSKPARARARRARAGRRALTPRRSRRRTTRTPPPSRATTSRR